MHAAVHGRRPLAALGLAGLFLGLAVASRPPILFGTLLFLPPLWLLMRRESRAWKTGWRYGLAAAAGLGLCGAALLAHNYPRFDNPLEFGQNFQLTSSRELSNRHFGWDYVRQNLRVYYFFPLRWSWQFPFASAQTPGWSIPDYAGSEEMCGLGVTFPFLWLALAAPLAVWPRTGAERRALAAIGGARLAARGHAAFAGDSTGAAGTRGRTAFCHRRSLRIGSRRRARRWSGGRGFSF